MNAQEAIEKAVQSQQEIKRGRLEYIWAALGELRHEEYAAHQRTQAAEQAFREAIDDLVREHPTIIREEKVGPWIKFHLVNTLRWSTEEVNDLEELVAYKGDGGDE